MKKLAISFYDMLGISSAFICLVHCLIFPILTIVPLGLSHNPIIDLFFAAIGLFAILKIMKKIFAFGVCSFSSFNRLDLDKYIK